MPFIDPIPTANMTDHQRAWFYAEFAHARRDEVIGILLAIFLGNFGIHQFYIRRNGLGILYLCFFWTGIPAILGFIDAFFMPGRVRRYNAEQAAYIASQILATPAQYAAASSTATSTVPHCQACGGTVESAAAFCPHCGATTTATSQPAV
jgi:TM2 domain-containing membrane protein YozV